MSNQIIPDLIQIRETTEKDIDAIARINVRMWQHAYKGLLPRHFLESLSVEERMKRRRAYMLDKTPLVSHFVATYKGTIIGFSDIGPGKGDGNEDFGEIYTLYVDPTVFRKGVGKVLLEAAQQKLKQADFQEAIVWQLKQNDIGREFYEKQGWQADGTQRESVDHGVKIVQVRYRKRL
jgi:ribosomal protein S18 acetylase RimI-like enzyme